MPENQPTAAAEVTQAADRLLVQDVTEDKQALSELLRSIAATWDQQEVPLREHTLRYARALDARFARASAPPAEPYCTWCGKKAAHVRALIQGPGTAICSDCIELVTVIANGE